MNKGLATTIIIIVVAIIVGLILILGLFTNFGTMPFCYTRTSSGLIGPCETVICGKGVICPKAQSNSTACTQNSDCIPVCYSWCGNVNYYKDKTINCPAITSPVQPKCVCQNSQCTKV